MIRLLLFTMSGLVALVGALASEPPTLLLLTPLVGLSVAVMVAIEAVDILGPLSARRAAVCAGLGGALFVPWVAGIVSLGSVGILIAAVCALLCGRAVTERWTGTDRIPAAEANVSIARGRGQGTPSSRAEWRARGR